MHPLGYKRELRARRDRKAFAALLATPGTGAVTFPANASVSMRSVAGCVAGTEAATFNGRSIGTPELDAGGTVTVGYIERGTVFTPAAGFEILIDTGLGRKSKIGEGV